MVGLSAAAGITLGGTNSIQARDVFPATHVKQALTDKFAPVNVSPDRIIRTVVDFRPYRPSGFVLKSAQLENKTIIHNYGHGGAGITLSWGTAALAMEEAAKTGAKDYAILGCGAIGLSTARLLQRRGFQVTIYAKDLPPQTTSNVAGALWAPVSVYNKENATPDFLNQFDRASQLSHRMFQDFVGDQYRVWWIKNHLLFREPPGVTPVLDGGNHLYHDIKVRNNQSVYFGYPYALQHYTMMIDPGIYLNAVLGDFYRAGGKLVVKQFDTSKDITSLSEPVVMNCTGLGARTLFDDKDLIPVRGQLSILLPQAEIDYAYVAPSYKDLLYMFPRKHEIILGGTSEPNNWPLKPSDKETVRILRGHARIAESL